MSTNPVRLQHLFNKYLNNTCTSAELQEFWQLMSELEESDPVTDDIKKLWTETRTGLYKAGDVNWDKAYTEMLSKAAVTELDYSRLGQKNKRIGWIRVAAAACIIGLVATGAWFYFKTAKPAVDIVKTKEPVNDALPGTTKAVLTLSDGRKITLDSAKTGELAVQGKTTVNHNNGALTYEGTNATAVLYNTLETGKGEQSPPLTLSDGTKVWLNAASSIRFPVAFTGNTREVEITGEAYFEVVHNSKKPFRVHAGSATIEDIGTAFNVNSYTDEQAMRTTLIEGAIKIGNALLKPGQQAVGGLEEIKVINHADIGQAMAWKNGLFSFQGADLPTVLRQLTRWYDVDVKYEGAIPQREFDGKLQRDLMLSQVLKILEKQKVHFKIDNKTIIVMP